MAPDGSNRHLAPRTINVRKFAESRASELESLHSIVAHRLGNDFTSQRNKRRRTTAHDKQVSNRKRRKRQKCSQSKDPEVETLSKLPRRIRRRNELRRNRESGFSVSGDGTKRLRTHVWHAKRFTMIKLWGFHLPLGLHGSGRGSRALLKRCKEGAVVHDASYQIAVQLEGPEDSLISILRMVLVNSTRKHPIDHCPSVLSGATYERAMLHRVGEPMQPICPVICIWRPLNEQNTDNSTQDYSANGHSQPGNREGSIPFRQLWVWIHASAFGEGYDALKAACQMEMVAQNTVISCSSLEGHIAQMELMGSSAVKLLEKMLHPMLGTLGKSLPLRQHSEVVIDDNRKDHISLEYEQFLDSAVLPLVVNDPRACGEEENTCAPTPSCSKDQWGSPHSPSANFGLGDLWDAKGTRPPVEDSVLCQEKHDRRMEFFFLTDPNSKISNVVEASQFSRTCPIMLLRRQSTKYPYLGWSIVLPVSWIKAFWVPLVTSGARAIGLREKRWISCEAGIPCFPSDFPDCSAYTSLMATEAAASDSKADLRPLKIRTMRIPTPPPWNCIHPSPSDALEGNSRKPAGREIYNIRSSDELLLFNERFGGHCLLFPHGVEREGSLQNALKKKVCPYPDDIINVEKESKLCFLRVILSAFKEGFFEEGAVVCAPRFSDILLWTSRHENNGTGLQIPESAVASYFKEDPTGTWVFQTPADPLARETHRRPIGFVTSGFVRGSKKPAAVAICEATSLARLRAEQWREVSVKRRKKEIYVLVRNLRSSAYRLALATILLEHQPDDLESL